MQSWHTTYLGLRELPREISTFELQSFFTYSRTERELINARRSNAHKLGLALHIGFLRLSGRLLNSVRIVPTIWVTKSASLLLNWHPCEPCMFAVEPSLTINNWPVMSWGFIG